MKVVRSNLAKIYEYLNAPEFGKDIIILAVCLYIFVFFSYSLNFLSDDAFITFRYVKNFLTGLGPVYNAGEYVEGFTSVLWFGLLGLLGRLGFDIVWIGRNVGLLFGSLQIILLYFFLKKIKISSVSRFLALLFISSSNIIAVWSLGGLEITMYSFFLLLNYVFLSLNSKFDKQKLFIFSIISILVILTRLEGLFVPVLATLWFVFKAKVKLKNLIFYYLLPFTFVIASSFLIRYSLYGQLLPNTFYAKVGANLDIYLRGLRYTFDFFLNYSFILFFIVLIIWGYINKTRTVLLALLFIFTIVTETVLVGGDGLPMYRFLLPALPYFTVLLAFFLAKIEDVFPNSYIKYIFMFSFAAILIYRAFAQPLVGNQYQIYLDQKNYEIPRWTYVGKWLKENAKPNETIALVPIGAVGYYSDRYIYDMLGLTNKYISHKKVDLGKGAAGHEKHDGPYILSQKPTFLLLGNIQVLDFKLDFDDPRFARPFNKVINEREDDIYTDELWQNYEKKIADVGGGYYLHYLKLK
ncbi:MAG: hypothetical protein HYW86_04700 [Candidatus Roizmanbacteria bacterium]|nr:MAG: hypothetical protein HYW86_04700 [Candidatus Roizmanbacteria bacterium]